MKKLFIIAALALFTACTPRATKTQTYKSDTVKQGNFDISEDEMILTTSTQPNVDEEEENSGTNNTTTIASDEDDSSSSVAVDAGEEE